MKPKEILKQIITGQTKLSIETKIKQIVNW